MLRNNMEVEVKVVYPRSVIEKNPIKIFRSYTRKKEFICFLIVCTNPEYLY